MVGLRQAALKVVTHSTALPGLQGGQDGMHIVRLECESSLQFHTELSESLPLPSSSPPHPPPSVCHLLFLH